MIPPLSKKRQRQNREYAKVRDKFLEEHRDCAVHGWTCRPTEVHHKKGRTGALLTDTRYFLAVCREAHIDIEQNPKWAKEKGYSLSRLAK